MPRKYNRKPNAKAPGRPRISIKPVTTGLPQKEIILDQVIYWIGIQATAQEIASSFHVSLSTLERAIYESFKCSFDDLRKSCEGTGKLSLRRYQFKQAEKNCSMAIWLGKQWLGQKDHEEVGREAPKDEDIELKNKLYAALYEIQQLRKELDDIKSASKPVINIDSFNNVPLHSFSSDNIC